MLKFYGFIKGKNSITISTMNEPNAPAFDPQVTYTINGETMSDTVDIAHFTDTINTLKEMLNA
jgi:hypothetical protein